MPHKVYVHSKARVNPAQSTHADFSYQLSAPIDIPQSRAFIDQVHLPNEFPTIHADNKYVYIEELIGSTSHKRKLALTEGTHDSNTITTHFQTALNNGSNMAANSYAVTFDAVTGKLSVATSDASNTFYVWSAEALAHGQWNPLDLESIPAYAPHDDAYDVLGFHDPIPQPGSQGSPVSAAAGQPREGCLPGSDNALVRAQRTLPYVGSARLSDPRHSRCHGSLGIWMILR